MHKLNNNKHLTKKHNICIGSHEKQLLLFSLVHLILCWPERTTQTRWNWLKGTTRTRASGLRSGIGTTSTTLPQNNLRNFGRESSLYILLTSVQTRSSRQPLRMYMWTRALGSSRWRLRQWSSSAGSTPPENTTVSSITWRATRKLYFCLLSSYWMVGRKRLLTKHCYRSWLRRVLTPGTIFLIWRHSWCFSIPGVMQFSAQLSNVLTPLGWRRSSTSGYWNISWAILSLFLVSSGRWQNLNGCYTGPQITPSHFQTHRFSLDGWVWWSLYHPGFWRRSALKCTCPMALVQWNLESRRESSTSTASAQSVAPSRSWFSATATSWRSGRPQSISGVKLTWSAVNGHTPSCLSTPFSDLYIQTQYPRVRSAANQSLKQTGRANATVERFYLRRCFPGQHSFLDGPFRQLSFSLDKKIKKVNNLQSPTDNKALHAWRRGRLETLVQIFISTN